ncbi:MerR family transcriptional regulator [Virgibacillus halodenitrificans]|uniref:MerR family transcriptional regulator n=1 Tax=Virgibacillus halodenitrificans TaxID=1482 RepID=UPI0024BF1B78|nr:MerR family transcriptional regulator [Virgibacillus halodenitrificans]WHX25425.1 MerR family transcriptional regulator [Virgibacillus halodenitrificans]
MYTVKEAAELLNLTDHTIRYYTDKELIPNLKRDQHNNRLFDKESLNWLLCVKHLRQCGMSLEDIKTYVNLCLKGDSTVKQRYNIMRKQQARALAQLEEARQRAAYIEEKANHYFDFIRGKLPDELDSEKWDISKGACKET